VLASSLASTSVNVVLPAPPLGLATEIAGMMRSYTGGDGYSPRCKMSISQSTPYAY
jgi:hypothetical protein